MKRYGNLFEAIISFDNLMVAARKALRGMKGKYRVAAFYFNLENELLALQEELSSKTYKPRPLRTFLIRDPKARKIGAPDFRDRVVHHAIFNVIEPIFEKGYIYHSYACRKEKGTHRAIRQVQKYCRTYNYVLKCDIKKYFESIDHQLLKGMLNRRFKDPDLLWLLNTIIDTRALNKRGIPIGSLTSQHFANYYLNKLDYYSKDTLKVKGYLRYMDDFLLFDNDKAKLHVLKSKISRFLVEELRLELKEKVTIIAPCNEGVPFLGFQIFPNLTRIKSENKRRLIHKLSVRVEEFRNGQITEEKYAQSLMSIAEHLKIGDTYNLRRGIFDKMCLIG